MSYAEWSAEGARRFGPDMMDWRFVCPVCKNIACGHDYRAAKSPESAIAFSCVGRWIPGSKEAFSDKGVGPCTYAGGGLFKLNPMAVTDLEGREHNLFAFADPLNPEGGG